MKVRGPAVAELPGATAEPLPDRLSDLAVRADRAAFAPLPPSRADAVGYWSDVEGTVRDLRLRVSMRVRVRARVSTRSLRRERTKERTGLRRGGRRTGPRRSS